MPRGGTLEPLNPKHIQARVRAGASAETIAAETGWALDRVTRYAGPPLAERAYVAERASQVEIRRDPTGTSTTLADSVSAALEGIGLFPDDSQWDAWRRTDAKWVVAVTHPGLPAGTVATWTYDPAGRNLHPLDEVARRFMESGHASIEDFLGFAETDPQAEPEPDPQAEPRPRLVAVPPAPKPTVAPASIEPTSPATAAWSGGSLARQPTVALSREPSAPATESTPAVDPPAAASQPASQPIARTSSQSSSEPAAEPRTTGASRPRPKGKGRRASVPSWDEILFGASKPEDQ